MELLQIGIAAGRGKTSNVLPLKAGSNLARIGRGQGDKLRGRDARQCEAGYSLPLGRVANRGGICFGICPLIPPVVARESRTMGGEFMVGTYAPSNQNAIAGRISCESTLRSWWGTEADRVGAGRADSQRGGGRASGTGTASATPKRPANHLSAHRPPPHGCWDHPSLGAGSALGKIPHLKNFLG